MTESRRKLTTILSADVQDYSRLMGADEEGTLATLKQYRDRMAALIQSYGGRVVNTWGDGLIAEFPSVVEAVRAAIDTQNELAGYNEAKPNDARMLFRIGINLGDVIADGADIYGDGVNIAARLQTSAPPGGIVISSTVYDHVRNKLTVGFDFLGALTVKNISEGVPSYAVRIGGVADGPQRVQPAGVAMPPPRRNAQSGTRNDDILAMPFRRMLSLFAVVGGSLVAINLLTWSGYFWAAWPIFAFAFISGLRWVRLQRRFNRQLAAIAITGLALIAINLLSWQGYFWAIWPLIALVVVAGIRWATVNR